MRTLFLFAVVLLCGVGQGMADDSPLFRLCLRGGDNPEAIEKSKSACTTYLALLMQGVRFGIVTKEQQDRPFCIPRGDLTPDQLNLLFAKIKADNANIKEGMEDMIASVVVTKAHRCSN
jgi:hypothetical protein